MLSISLQAPDFLIGGFQGKKVPTLTNGSLLKSKPSMFSS